MYKLLIFYLLFHHELMIFIFGFRERIVLFISALVVWIIFMLGKFPGNESFRIEIASPFSIC